jgi:hypothetical protein
LKCTTLATKQPALEDGAVVVVVVVAGGLVTPKFLDISSMLSRLWSVDGLENSHAATFLAARLALYQYYIMRMVMDDDSCVCR